VRVVVDPLGDVLGHGLDQAREAFVVLIAVGVLVQLEHLGQGESAARVAQIEVLRRRREVAQLQAVLHPLLAAPQFLGDLLNRVASAGAQPGETARLLHRVEVTPLEVFQHGGF